MKIEEILEETINNDEQLTEEESKLRLKILNMMVDRGGPIDVSEIKAKDKECFNGLLDKCMFVIENEAITFAYPVSGKPTHHIITLEDGRVFHSMCAIDSLGSTFTFHQDLHIDSKCSKTGEKITLDIIDGEIRNLQPNSTCVLHVELEQGENWAASC